MRNVLTAAPRHTKLGRVTVTGITALGAAGIATTALAGTAQAASAPAKPAANVSAAAKGEKDSKSSKADDEGKADDGGKDYADNLDGWIREARDIMKDHGIPGSYDGIKRNIIRESSGDPDAVNNWDVNAKKGTPSRGLLQVIQPTFDRFHIKDTPDKLTDPVANIVAACNYAADRYGSMDNVDSAY